jgi:cell division protein FtsN
MRFFSLKRFGLLAVLVVAIGLFIFFTTHAQANSPTPNDSSNPATSKLGIG